MSTLAHGTRARLGRIACAALLAVAFPHVAPAQAITVVRGALTNSDGDSEERFPTYGLRLAHEPWRFLVIEAGVQHAPVKLTRYEVTGPESAVSHSYAAPRRSADLQVQLQLPAGPLRPYVGAGLGAFTYRRLPGPGQERARLTGSYKDFTLGMRAHVGPHVTGLMEGRVRFDQPSFGYLGVDYEWALGLGIRR